MKTYNKYAQFFAIIKKIGRDKDEVIWEFTSERLDENGQPGNSLATKSLSALTEWEYAELLRRLQRFNEFPPGDDMRKSIIATCRNMRWETRLPNGQLVADMARINNWCKYSERSPFKKPLIDHTEPELQKLVSVMKKIYQWYLTAN